jgi:hypothetical protein
MQGVTHALFRGREDAFSLRLESCFHVPTRFNICSGSQVEGGFLAECTLLLSAVSTKERKTSRNQGVRRKVLGHLMQQVGAPCGEGSGTEREVNILVWDTTLEAKHRLCSL